MIFLQIAWSNLIRNRRRTVVTLLAIMVGIAMMVFANGFTDGLSRQWADSMIDRTDGHLQVHHKDFYKYGVSDMERIYMQDPEGLMEVIQQNPHVVSVMPRVSIGGMLGKDDNSTIFAAAMTDIDALDATLPAHANLIVEGQALSPDDPDGVVVGKALAKSIGAGVGDDLVILSSTVYGDQSAALVTVRGLFQDKNNANAESAFILGGLSEQIREDLLDIGGGATELIVRIDDMDNVEAVSGWLNQRFAERGAPWIVQPWYDNEGFSMLMGIFNGIRIAVLIVLALIVSFIISSTLMMSIFERIQEVGSMRAVGMENGSVYRLFYIEYVMTTVLGGLIGIVVGALLVALGNYTGITISSGIFEGVRPVLQLQNVLISFFVPLLVAAVFALFPIRSSCRMSVVDSLNYN